MVEMVRVRYMMPPRHVRTPAYLRGKTGRIERQPGSFATPDQAAYGVKAAKMPLFRVRFRMDEIWGNDAENPEDTLDAEIFGHWLENADAP